MAEQDLNFFKSPEVLQWAEEESVEKNALITSGAVVNDPVLEQAASGGSQDVTVAWNQQVDHDDEPDYINTDPTVKSTPGEMTGEEASAMVAYQHNSWQIAKLLPALIRQPDPAGALARMISGYKMSRQQRRLVASLQGIIADNVANDDADMANNIYSDIATPLAANKPSLEAIITTSLTSGDRRGIYGIMAAHSITVANLEILDAGGFSMEKDSVGGIPDIKTYRGMVVIEDDGMTVEAGTNSPKYYTYFLGSGAIGWANAPLPSGMRKSSVATEDAAGNGGGVDTFHYRWADVLNPYGINFTKTTISAKSPTIADLKLAVNWDRKVNRKLVPISCLIHNN